MKIAAQILSLVAHPLLMFTYMLGLLLLVNPYMFGVSNAGAQIRLIMLVFLSTFFMPAVAIVMMKAVGFVGSLEMKDRHDRIVPYISTGVFYLSIYYFLLKMPEVPVAFKMFMLGGIISLFTAFFVNNFSKISIHTVGMGGLIGMTFILLMFFRQTSFPIETEIFGMLRISTITLLLVILFLSGLVGTARMYLGAHRPIELWGGYLVGLFGQLVALTIVY